MSSTSEYTKGEKVFFGRTRGEKTLGEVVKVNPSRLKVKQLEARGGHPVGTLWNVAPGLCSKTNGASVAPVAAPPAPKRPEAEILREILGVYNNLSPENLWADGERSASEARRVGAHLRGKLRELFRELGRTVTEEEAYRLAPARAAW